MPRPTDSDRITRLQAVPDAGTRFGAADRSEQRTRTPHVPGTASEARPVDAPSAHEPGDDALCIDCDECVMQGTRACDDCIVTFVCSREPGEALVVDVEEERALRLLSGAGLLPKLHHVRRTG